MSKELTLEDAFTCIGKLTVENEKLKIEKAKYWEWYLEERTSIHKLEEELKALKGEKEDIDEPGAAGSDFDADIKKDINDNLD